jgi:glutamate transport system permease protein
MGAVLDNLPLYLEGFRTTLALTLVSGVAALLFGTAIAALRLSPIAPLRLVGAGYVEIVRNTPLTLVFFFVVFVLPRLGAIFPFFVSALVALSVYTAAFVCEAVRSGINSVGLGQSEAARSIGLTFGQSLRLIVLPQALRSVVPPLISVFIALTKNSSIAGVFFVGELFNVGRRLATDNPDAVVAVLLGVAFFYLLITVPAGVLAARLERRVAFAR